MKNIKVSLLHVTPSHVVSKAVSMPYNTEPSLDIANKVITKLRHTSCAEHIVMNWLIEGTSRAELQEHMRHRMASPTVKSTRYTLGKDLRNSCDLFVTPIKADSIDEDIFNDFISKKAEWEQRAMELIKEFKDKGLPNDYLKYLLPESYRTGFTWTVNLRSFINFLELRNHPTAHMEIRTVAKQMREVIKNTPETKYIHDILTGLKIL